MLQLIALSQCRASVWLLTRCFLIGEERYFFERKLFILGNINPFLLIYNYSDCSRVFAIKIFIVLIASRTQTIAPKRYCVLHWILHRRKIWKSPNQNARTTSGEQHKRTMPFGWTWALKQAYLRYICAPIHNVPTRAVDPWRWLKGTQLCGRQWCLCCLWRQNKLVISLKS